MRYLLLISLPMLLAGCTSNQTTADWLRQLKDPDVVKRRQAIRELGVQLTDAGPIAAALAEALHDNNSYVRHDAALTLGKLGPEARPAVPHLTVALKDKERSVRKAAARALKRINNKAKPTPEEG
jgi:HEAT repeat protein